MDFTRLGGGWGGGGLVNAHVENEKLLGNLSDFNGCQHWNGLTTERIGSLYNT